MNEENSSLSKLREISTVVADTASFASIKAYKPLDATTNPTLILQALQADAALISEAKKIMRATEESMKSALAATAYSADEDSEDILAECLLAIFAVNILGCIEGRVSIEVPSSHSFHSADTVLKAKRMLRRTEAVYEILHGKPYSADKGGDLRQRILIKIAATWPGIEAARILEESGIHCNITLLFSLSQAICCAQKQITLISPFVGRVVDWYAKQAGGEKKWSIQKDPGVLLVKRVYAKLKSMGSQTEIMAASFRNIEQILELAGCDLLTIAPKLLEELAKSREKPMQKLAISKLPSLQQTLRLIAAQLREEKAAYAWPSPSNIDSATSWNEHAKQPSSHSTSMSEQEFLWQMNENPMALEKLAEGIRIFHADYLALKTMLLSSS